MAKRPGPARRARPSASPAKSAGRGKTKQQKDDEVVPPVERARPIHGDDVSFSIGVEPIGDIDEIAALAARLGVDIDRALLEKIRDAQPAIEAALDADADFLDKVATAPAETLAPFLDARPSRVQPALVKTTKVPSLGLGASQAARDLFQQLLTWLAASPANAASFLEEAFAPVRQLGATGPPAAVAEVIEALEYAGFSGRVTHFLPGAAVDARAIGLVLRDAQKGAGR